MISKEERARVDDVASAYGFKQTTDKIFKELETAERKLKEREEQILELRAILRRG